MSTALISKALFGHYEPTGVYSFEFRKVGAGSLFPGFGPLGLQIFLAWPPEDVTVVEAQRSELMPTLGGGYLSDQGNDFKKITVTGSFHFYYVGSSTAPLSYKGNGVDDRFLVDGYTEFIKLRFILSRYRDYTMTDQGRVIAPVFTEADNIAVEGLRQIVTQKAATGEGVLADQYEMIWHDYDYDDHYKVKIDQLTMSRSSSDVWTVNYSIEMMGYLVDDSAPRNSFPFRQPTVKRVNTIAQLKRSYTESTILAQDSIPTTINIISPQGPFPVGNSNLTPEQDELVVFR